MRPSPIERRLIGKGWGIRIRYRLAFGWGGTHFHDEVYATRAEARREARFLRTTPAVAATAVRVGKFEVVRYVVEEWKR